MASLIGSSLRLAIVFSSHSFSHILFLGYEVINVSCRLDYIEFYIIQCIIDCFGLKCLLVIKFTRLSVKPLKQLTLTEHFGFLKTLTKKPLLVINALERSSRPRLPVPL